MFFCLDSLLQHELQGLLMLIIRRFLTILRNFGVFFLILLSL